MYIKLCHEEQREGLGSRVVCIYPGLSLDEIRVGRRALSLSPFDFSLPFSSSSSAHRLSLSLTLPDVAEMGTQPRRRLQTFLSGLFTELQFLVFATFLYITGPVTRILLSPTFSLYPSLLCFFLSFFYIDISIDRSFLFLYQQRINLLLLLLFDNRDERNCL